MRLMLSVLLAIMVVSPATAVELRIISPGIVYNAALNELVEDYNKKSGNTAIIVRGTMDKIIGQAKSDTPPADVIGLPPDLMNTLYLDGGIVGASYTPLGRGELALAVKKGAAKPDISTVAKLAQAMNGRTVMVNDPKGGTMQGVMIDGILKRAEFAGAHVVPSSKGEGASALARGEGDMAVQLVQEILRLKLWRRCRWNWAAVSTRCWRCRHARRIRRRPPTSSSSSPAPRPRRPGRQKASSRFD